MAFKQSRHIFKGMSKDLADDKKSAEFYIDAHNIRLTARENETFLSVTNEKGNTKLTFDGITEGFGQYLGHAIADDYLVLFTTTGTEESKKDHIFRINLETKKVKELCNANIGFSVDHPIETLVDIETEDIKKVYWTDGINQPRMINIMTEDSTVTIDGYTKYDFLPEVYKGVVSKLIEVSIDKGANGRFKAGTIQYFLTFSNKYGQESNVVWQSRQLYASPWNRGGSVTETCNCSFTLNITIPDGIGDNFNILNVYSIQHTSKDTDIIAKKIISLEYTKILGSNNKYKDVTLTVIDNGQYGEDITPTDLYYKGGVPLCIGTMTQKDQVLFLGNIESKVQTFNYLINALNYNDFPIKFESVERTDADNIKDTYYDYKNQLNETKNSITTFKYLEHYRLGLQFQDKYGRWSQPLRIPKIENVGDKEHPEYIDKGDWENDISPTIDNNKIKLANATLRTTKRGDDEVDKWVDALKKQGFVAVRPVVVLPYESEREVVCQGVVNPTVYNIEDRKTNSPYAQASWFFRPNNPYSIPFTHNAAILGKVSSHAELENAMFEQCPPTTGNSNVLSDFSKKYNYFIDQSIVTLNSPEILFESPKIDDNNFRIIGSINSKRFAGNYHIETEGAKLNYYSPSRGNQYTKYTRQDQGIEFWNFIGNERPEIGDIIEGVSKSIVDYKTTTDSSDFLVNGCFWYDTPYVLWSWGTDTGALPSSTRIAFKIYPWQSAGGLNASSNHLNDYGRFYSGIPITETSTLNYKVLANLRVSDGTKYLAKDKQIDYEQGVDIVLCNQSTVQTDSYYGKLNYYGDVDKLLDAPDRQDFSTFNFNSLVDNSIIYDCDTIGEEESSSYKIQFTKKIDKTNVYKTERIRQRNQAPQFIPRYNVEGSPVRCLKYTATEVLRANGYDPIERELTDYYIERNCGYDIDALRVNTVLSTKNTATHITYRSTPHAVITLNGFYSEKNKGTTQTILPQTTTTAGYMSDNDGGHKYGINNTGILGDFFWKTNRFGYNYISYKTKNDDDVESNYLWIGECYNAYNKDIKYGGLSDYAVQQNMWVPAGPVVPLKWKGDQLADFYIDIVWDEGDTYFQRWDCLKTYPYSNESTNNIVEILSFMCETRINIAGRHDLNRGLADNTFITNENFNLMNDVYSQQNNFFSYRILDERFYQDKFTNQITWTKAKKPAAEIDNWTNVVLANTLNLDGNKGEITSLNKYNDRIVAFQKKGIAEVRYNERIQLSTAQNVPIELANSQRVEGYSYISNNIGCQNKWSINDESPYIYFVDNYSKDIYRIGGGESLVNNLTSKHGFKSWIENNNSTDVWHVYSSSENTSNSFRTFYDKTFKDVYFVNGNTTLVYSEVLDEFVSFMDYQQTNAMFNLNDKFYAIDKTTSLYEQFSGTYNKIYDTNVDSYITFMENDNPYISKIFTNLEFRSDLYNNDDLVSDRTFDTIQVWNEYQDSEEQVLKNCLDPIEANLKRKFRIWRVQLPRDKKDGYGRNRIANTWTKIKLTKNKILDNSNTINERLVLHDFITGYYF